MGHLIGPDPVWPSIFKVHSFSITLEAIHHHIPSHPILARRQSAQCTTIYNYCDDLPSTFCTNLEFPAAGSVVGSASRTFPLSLASNSSWHKAPLFLWLLSTRPPSTFRPLLGNKGQVPWGLGREGFFESKKNKIPTHPFIHTRGLLSLSFLRQKYSSDRGYRCFGNAVRIHRDGPGLWHSA